MYFECLSWVDNEVAALYHDNKGSADRFINENSLFYIEHLDTKRTLSPYLLKLVEYICNKMIHKDFFVIILAQDQFPVC